jgi:hypothetical protein
MTVHSLRLTSIDKQNKNVDGRPTTETTQITRMLTYADRIPVERMEPGAVRGTLHFQRRFLEVAHFLLLDHHGELNILYLYLEVTRLFVQYLLLVHVACRGILVCIEYSTNLSVIQKSGRLLPLWDSLILQFRVQGRSVCLHYWITRQQPTSPIRPQPCDPVAIACIWVYIIYYQRKKHFF